MEKIERSFLNSWCLGNLENHKMSLMFVIWSLDLCDFIMEINTVCLSIWYLWRQTLSVVLLSLFFLVWSCGNLSFLGHCNFQSWDRDTVRDCSARCQQSQMSQVSLSHSWHFQCGGLMENYIISFPKHFHYCNKGSVCFVDILARESMQRPPKFLRKRNPICMLAHGHTCT